MSDPDWTEGKQQGADHYKTGGTEPVDLYRALGALHIWALVEICQHAIRQLPDRKGLNASDLDKIIDYAQKLKATLTQPLSKNTQSEEGQ